MADRCSYSDKFVKIAPEQLQQCVYVECPECGSIRKIGGRQGYHYPIHNTLMGTARARNNWWKREGRDGWKLAQP